VVQVQTNYVAKIGCGLSAVDIDADVDIVEAVDGR